VLKPKQSGEEWEGTSRDYSSVVQPAPKQEGNRAPQGEDWLKMPKERDSLSGRRGTGGPIQGGGQKVKVVDLVQGECQKQEQGGRPAKSGGGRKNRLGVDKVLRDILSGKRNVPVKAELVCEEEGGKVRGPRRGFH